MFLISRACYKNLHGRLLSIFGMWYLKVDFPENILKRGRISFPKIDLYQISKCSRHTFHSKRYTTFKRGVPQRYQILPLDYTSSSSIWIGSTYLLNDYIFRCASHVSPECNLGVNRVHILPPVAICPIVLDRQHSVSKEKLSQRSKNSHEDRDAQAVLVSFFLSHFMT